MGKIVSQLERRFAKVGSGRPGRGRWIGIGWVFR